MGMAIHEDLRPLASQYARLLLRRKRPDERLAILGRVRHALCSEAVLKILRPDLTRKDEG